MTLNQLLRLIEALSLLEKIKFGVGGRKKKGYLEVCLKKKQREEGRLDCLVEKVNDIWIMVKVCLSTIIENRACSIVLMRYIKLVFERV